MLEENCLEILRANCRPCLHFDPTLQLMSNVYFSSLMYACILFVSGSGKTAAFLFPIISDILFRGPQAVKPKQIINGRTCQFPVALIMAPTRELSMQIYQEACKFAYRLPIEVGVLYGGQENRRAQVDALRVSHYCFYGTSPLWTYFYFSVGYARLLGFGGYAGAPDGYYEK